MMIENIFEIGVCVLISSLIVYGKGIMEWFSKPRETPDINLNNNK